MIQVEQLAKIYAPDVVAVDGLSFEIASNETLALIGASGCGKTTTLKMLNRMVEPTRGSIHMFGEDLLAQDAIQVRRKIGYVIQGGGLFPHWTARQNIGLVPRLLGWESERIDARTCELLELVKLPAETFGERFPAEMSGGQQQRVGIARALAAEPPVILWDEPFSALDPVTRRGLHKEFLQLKRTLNKAMVIVTHDMQEAFRLADKILLLDGGRQLQMGTPQELKMQPATETVRRFIEEAELA